MHNFTTVLFHELREASLYAVWLMFCRTCKVKCMQSEPLAGRDYGKQDMEAQDEVQENTCCLRQMSEVSVFVSLTLLNLTEQLPARGRP